MCLQADDWLESDMDKRFGPFSDCAKSHVAVKPKKGTLIPDLRTLLLTTVHCFSQLPLKATTVRYCHQILHSMRYEAAGSVCESIE